MPLERVKVAVAMKQLEARFDAKGRNKTVDGLPDSKASLAKNPMVSCCCDGYGPAGSIVNIESGKFLSYTSKSELIVEPLKHFTENQIGKTDG